MLALLGGGFTHAAEPKIDAEDLRPGLVTTYQDPSAKNPAEIVLLEPTVALALKKGEAPHPRLSAEGGTVRWQGYLNVLRPDSYRFSVILRGKLRVTVAGKEMLAAEVKMDAPQRKHGPGVRLEAGVHPLLVEFTRLPGSARVELLWQAPQFRTEPLPHDAVGHLPARLPARLHSSVLLERGRYLAEERNCTACHRPDDRDRMAATLVRRQGPDLSQVGRRVHAGWLYRWLEAPQKIRPGSRMPQMFTNDEAGRVERYAVTRYLTSLGGPLKSPAMQISPKDLANIRKRGKDLFTSLGCIACHQPDTEKAQTADNAGGLTGARKNYPLSGLGSKTTPERLAAYLQNPLAVDPGGRMPSLLLKNDEASVLAHYLGADQDPAIPAELPEAPSREQMVAVFRRVDSRAEELAAFRRLSEDVQWKDLGKRLVIDKGCNNCHTIAPGGKGFANMLASASFDDVKSVRVAKQGCLSDDPGKRGKAPWFDLGAAERDALRHFLAEGTKGAGSPAPAHAARVTLERFNCLACHSRDGEGGLSTGLVDELRKLEKADNAEAVVPPPLTGVGHKLRTPWLRDVLTRAGRARPWMGLRMPQFGAANVGHLPEALAALEGTEPDDRVYEAPVTSARIEAGRRLVGAGGFGCITCHDLAGIPNHGTRGPDLAQMNQRVRYGWYRRWLEQPQRMQPGTRMPMVFPDGRSTNETVLGGKADAQAEAMWAYLSLGPSMQLPEGMEPPKGLVLAVKDRPVLLRTFMPEAGSRAVAIGLPGGVATVFDAATCRLAYGWSGNFLDASPVWNDRGGRPAKVLGLKFWTAPRGCPWAVHDSNKPPDFAARAADPAYGADPGEGKVFQGQRLLSFEGYETDRDGFPTFRYRLDAVGGEFLRVRERPLPLRSPAGVGLARHFSLDVPKQRPTWLLAGEARQEPRLLDGKGNPVALDLRSGKAEVAAAGRLLVLPQGGGRAIALLLTAAPEGARWHLQRRGDAWTAILGLPAAREAARVKVDLSVWSPHRDDPGLLKELLPTK
jgi:mono/diheme cytochrome c family protein